MKYYLGLCLILIAILSTLYYIFVRPISAPEALPEAHIKEMLVLSTRIDVEGIVQPVYVYEIDIKRVRYTILHTSRGVILLDAEQLNGRYFDE